MSFVVWKNNGGLTIPSSSLLKICHETEKCLIRMLNTTSGKLPQCSGIVNAIATAVLSTCIGSDIFETLDEHMYDCTATNNHIASLVKCCSQCYSKIRMHHLAKVHTAKLQGKKVRKQLSKLILFSHQWLSLQSLMLYIISFFKEIMKLYKYIIYIWIRNNYKYYVRLKFTK